MDLAAIVFEMLGPFKYVALALFALGLLGFLLGIIFGDPGGTNRVAKEKRLFEYRAKQSIMTSAEQNFYNALGMAVAHEYRIFAQVRLSALVSHTIPNGQNWKGALAHINQKSVDFVLSDKETLATKLVIELDDRSHEREDRHERDEEVERILAVAGIPLLRIQNQRDFNHEELRDKVHSALTV